MKDKVAQQERLEGLKSTLALVKELQESKAYQAVMLPEFEKLEKHHARECRNKALTWEKRAEHIEAADLAERLSSFLEDRARELDHQIREARKGL